MPPLSPNPEASGPPRDDGRERPRESGSPALTRRDDAHAEPAKQAGVLILGTTLATLSSALLPLVLVRLIGKGDLAELLALLFVYDTVALVITAGFPQTLMFHLPGRAASERRAIAVRVGWIMVGLGVAAALVLLGVGALGDRLPGLFARPSADRLSLVPLLVLAPSMVAELPFRVVTNLLVAERKARVASAVGVLRTIATTLATLVPVALGASVWVVAVWYSLARGVFGLALPWAITHVYAGVERAPSPISTRTLFRFAIPLGATDVVSLLNQQFDRWLILLSFPAAAFAEYQAGAWQVPVISTIAYSVGAAYTPSLVERFKAGAPREAMRLWQDSIAKVSLIVLPVTMGFIVGAEELMTLLFTSAYLPAAPIFRLYSILTLGRVATFGSVIVAAGKPRYVLRAAIFSLVVNVLLCVPLTWALGFIGPALGTVLAFIPMVVFYVYCISKAARLPLREIFPLSRYAQVLSLTTLAGALAYFAKLQVASPLLSLLTSLIVTVVTFTALGAATRVIARADFRYAADWFRLKILR